MAYKVIKRVITRGGYNKNDIMDKLDAYLAADRITVAQYKELVELVNSQAGGDDDSGAE